MPTLLHTATVQQLDVFGEANELPLSILRITLVSVTDVWKRQVGV